MTIHGNGNKHRTPKTIVHRGYTYTYAQLAERHGLNVETLRNRLRRGATIDEALSREKRQGKKLV